MDLAAKKKRMQMDTVKLKGKSRKGKNRIREHGDTWTILERRENVRCCIGPALLIKSADGKDLRWISERNDRDFDIMHM